MKDHALAATNAIKQVWNTVPTESIVIGTCSWHAGSHWMEDTGKKFLKKQDNKHILKKDLENLKNCPYVHLVDFFTEAMLTKWEDVLKEGTGKEFFCTGFSEPSSLDPLIVLIWIL